MREAHAAGIRAGICGQGPSNHPDFAAFLMGCGIDSISLNLDSFLPAMRHVAAAEAQLRRTAKSSHRVVAAQSAEAGGGEPHSFQPVRDGCR